MRLLFVHGRSQGGQNPTALSGQWQSALKAGLIASRQSLPAGVKIDFPFYGDRLDQFAAQFDVPADDVATAKGVGGQDEFADFAREMAS